MASPEQRAALNDLPESSLRSTTNVTGGLSAWEGFMLGLLFGVVTGIVIQLAVEHFRVVWVP